VTAKGKLAATLDPVIHPITRLSICGLLASGADWVEFAALRDAAGISDSVLSKQSRILEDAGYVEVRKGAVGRRPRTWFRLTPNGREAFQAHVAWLQQAARVRPEDAADDTAHQAPPTRRMNVVDASLTPIEPDTAPYPARSNRS
jgi:DNA-binding MarR family transcriptional regulator